jgi:hypothetical protein
MKTSPVLTPEVMFIPGGKTLPDGIPFIPPPGPPVPPAQALQEQASVEYVNEELRIVTLPVKPALLGVGGLLLIHQVEHPDTVVT